MSTITVEQTAQDAASRSLRVTVPVERVQAAEEKAVSHFARRARLPGFRPGKAPIAVVRRRFEDAIRQSVLEELVREGWDTAQESAQLKPVADPSVRNLRFEAGQPLEFDLVVEVKPEVTLQRTGGFRLTRPSVAVTDAMVEEQLEQVRDQRADWIPVGEGKPSTGHLVRVEVASAGADGAFGAAQPFELVIGQGQTVPEIEEAIVGLVPGATAEVKVANPERTVRVTLREVKRKELPPLDDAFAREVGDFEGLAALRAAIREDLGRAAEREADAAVRDQLVRQLVEANGLEAPPSLVRRLLHGYLHMAGIPHEKEEEFARQMGPAAEQQVKRDLVLEAVIEARQLAATEAELDERVARLAEARRVSPGEMYATLQKGGRLAELARAIAEEKAFAWLLAQSTVETTQS